MIDTFFRPYLEKIFFDPIARALALNQNIKPQQISLAALLSGLCAAISIGLHFAPLALMFLAISAFCDIMDGSIARLRSQDSPAGAFIDLLSDRCVESSIVIGLYSFDPASRGFLSLFMLTSILLCITSFLVSAIFTKNEGKKSFHYSPGLMERSEAFIMFALLIAFPQRFTFLAFIFIILVLLTTFIRSYQFFKIYSFSFHSHSAHLGH